MRCTTMNIMDKNWHKLQMHFDNSGRTVLQKQDLGRSKWVLIPPDFPQIMKLDWLYYECFWAGVYWKSYCDTSS